MDHTDAGEVEPQAAMQAEAVARLIRPEDTTRLMNLLRVLVEVSEGTRRDAENDVREKQARQLVTETGQRLQAFAGICEPDDPLLTMKQEWYLFFKLDNKAQIRSHFRVLQWKRIRAAIELAERVRQLLAAKCLDPVDVDETAATVVEKAATVVHQRDTYRLRSLADLLKGPALEEDVRDAVSKIRQRMEEIAATEGEDATPQKLLTPWRELHLVDVQELVRNEGAVTYALALVRATEEFLNSRRLAAKCPEKVEVDETAATGVEKAATGVQQKDINRLESLAAYLDNAVNSSFLDSGHEKVIRDTVNKIWRRLQKIATTEGKDSALQELLGRWQKLYRIKSRRVHVDIRELVREKGNDALALVQETRDFLVSRRPDGA